MSYQVLARKWRPKSFREMAGQGHVLKALINALDHDRLHHAYLFTGTRGVGKTTIARILAKCLNCETGISSEPCGQCSSCLAIGDGRFVDLIEVDAASRTRVEDTRELLDNVQYAPSQGRYKVYLIDEVHMLSASSFNALLKTLEEPPPHVKFLLATTDPQKIPATILSRCLQFSLKNLSPERIVDYLRSVLDKEMISFEEGALWLLGRAADGSMRDALSLTDQGIAFGGGKLQEQDIRQMLGTIDHDAVYRMLSALNMRNGAQLIDIVANVVELGVDPAAVVNELLTVLHRLALAQVLPDSLDNSLGDRQRLLELAAQLPAEDVQFFYQMALAGRRDFSLSPDARAALEMLLLRMLAFCPEGVGEPPSRPLPGDAAVQEAVHPVKKPQAETPPPAAPPTGIAKTTPSEAPPPGGAPPEGMPAATGRRETPPWEDIEAPDAPASSQPAPAPAQAQAGAEVAPAEAEPAVSPPAAAPTPAATNKAAGDDPLSDHATGSGAVEAGTTPTQEKLDFATLDPQHWRQCFDDFALPGMLGSVASHCQIVDKAEGRIDFCIDAANAALLNPRHVERLGELLSQYFEQPIKVSIDIGSSSEETPAAYRARRFEERLQLTRQALAEDPVVNSLIAEFDAVLDENSVQFTQAPGGETV